VTERQLACNKKYLEWIDLIIDIRIRLPKRLEISPPRERYPKLRLLENSPRIYQEKIMEVRDLIGNVVGNFHKKTFKFK